ncbi:hypothetical protein D9M68_895290 [compost metagenome]
MRVARSPGPPTTRSMAPRLSWPQITLWGASAFGRKRPKPLTVGVHSAVMPSACASRPASQWAPASDSVWRASARPLPGAGDSRMQALRPVARSTSDWCRCQPLDMMWGNGGRHMKVAW